MKFISKTSESEKIKQDIANLFEELFKRTAETETINYHYLRILSGLSFDDLRNEFKNSLEYKITHPLDDTTKLNPEERMKAEWDERAKMDARFAIFAVPNTSEEDFWKSGIKDRDMILGKGLSRYDLIFNGKESNHMKCIEIGCGIGRILVPMSEIFEEVNEGESTNG